MLTLFTVPKPFRGHVGDIQRNAVDSWRALHPEVQVVLVGDEDGVEAAARDAGVEHVGGLERNERGTPRLDSAFELVARRSRWPLWCFINADIVLLDDFLPTIERLRARFSDFLIIGESRDLDVAAGTRLQSTRDHSQLRKRALEAGRLRGYAALDYFVFHKGLFDPVPPFLIGRACFDNWLVWRARDRGRPVVDATRSVVAVHQAHDYSHVAGGLEEVYYGEEAQHNEQLAGGREHIYSLHDATHRIYGGRMPVPYWGSVFRAREKARVAKVSAEIHLTARRARRADPGPGARPLRMLGVAVTPSPETSGLFDVLAHDQSVDLTVLYARAQIGAASPEPLRHEHVFVRSIQVVAVERALGREYPITWAIWHGFHVLRPDCMVIAGWSTYPAQAAIAWCVARRMPFVLLIGRTPDVAGGRLRRRLADFAVQSSAAVVYSDAPDAPTHLLDATQMIRQSIQRHARRRRSRSASSDRRG